MPWKQLPIFLRTHNSPGISFQAQAQHPTIYNFLGCGECCRKDVKEGKKVVFCSYLALLFRWLRCILPRKLLDYSTSSGNGMKLLRKEPSPLHQAQNTLSWSTLRTGSDGIIFSETRKPPEFSFWDALQHFLKSKHSSETCCKVGASLRATKPSKILK